MLKKLFTIIKRNNKRSLVLLRRLGPVLWQTLKRFESTERRRDAAALTYTTLFALVPVLTVIYSILSAIPALHEWGGELNSKMLLYVLPEGSEQVTEYLLGFSQQAKRLTWVGVVFLLVTALMLLRTIEIQFNRIWKVDKPRSGIQIFFRYWAVLSLGPVFIVGALAINSVIVSLPLMSDLGKAPIFVRVLPWLFSSVALAALYMLVPNCRVPWRNALFAALLIAAVLELGKFMFARVVGMFPSYKLIYGAFAVVPLFLLWMYLSWMLMLFGAELSYALSHYAPADRKMPVLWRRLLLVQLLVQQQEKGELLSEAELIKRLDNLTPVQVRVELQRLQEKNQVALTQDGYWVWLPNIERITLAELFHEMSLKDLCAALPEEARMDNEQREKWQQWQSSWQSHSEKVLGRSVSELI